MAVSEYGARERRGVEDKRGLWDNSPELRDSVRDKLTDWGQAMRGGLPDLGYPHEQPFSVSPQPATHKYNVDEIDLITATLSRWMRDQHKIGDVELALLLVLRFHFLSDRPAEAKARALSVSKRTFWRRVDESMFRFWCRHNCDGFVS